MNGLLGLLALLRKAKAGTISSLHNLLHFLNFFVFEKQGVLGSLSQVISRIDEHLTELSYQRFTLADDL